ncbi:endonuclease domain-containing protein [Klebsiella pneumoniae]|nr:endonuclease domain-containing protein [Klebsiella pneumoniae]MCL3328573.1 endonuclease domain-containing protein [Klebsiella pneumoniae]MCL3355499.1 endonuclease domain-containing protein [Klebsiella pneumoniae]
MTTTGWRVLRFWNIEFEEYGDAVMEGILEAPESPMPSPLPSD